MSGHTEDNISAWISSRQDGRALKEIHRSEFPPNPRKSCFASSFAIKRGCVS